MANPLDALHAFALTLPSTTADVACAGTALESRTAKVHGKAFLFVGAGVIRLKLGDSIAAAQACAEREPERYEIGKGGWVKVVAAEGLSLPVPLLKRWVRESHALFAAGVSKSNASPRKKAAAAKKAPRAQ
jgi:hypothetical protein